jgi:2-polyprenyl-6-methoxyphenol hydroxylase-like FAD-dependent oxidoreductase
VPGVSLPRVPGRVGLVSDGLPGVRVHEGNGERVYRARLVVGVDGRNSVCRRWGGFHVDRDPEGMIIAGLLMQGLAAPGGPGERFFRSAPQHALFDGSARRRSLPQTMLLAQATIRAAVATTQPQWRITGLASTCWLVCRRSQRPTSGVIGAVE